MAGAESGLDNQSTIKPSRLVLGTAQLGMDYGIANQTGQPDSARAQEVVQKAWEAGIREFDTAQGYGSSEQVLGQALTELKKSRQALITTKLGHSLDLRGADFRRSLEGSLKRLGVNRLAGLLLHKEEQLDFLDQGLEPVLKSFLDQGLVERIGVSVYSPGRAIQALNNELIEIVQLPANLLDHRFRKAGVFDLAREKEKLIYLRSVFLQGLLLMAPEHLPAGMVYARPMLSEAGRLAKEMNLSRMQLTLGYVKLAYPRVKVLVGAETPDQVRENIRIWSGSLDPGLVGRVEETFREVESKVLDPRLWPKEG